MSDQAEFRRLSQRIEGLVGSIETIADPYARANSMELAQSLMELHGAGLGRMMEIVARAGEQGYALMDDFAGDELVASLLLLYGLHPYDLETRVMRALEETRPLLRSHGGDVELLGVSEGVVRLRLAGSRQSCPSSTMTLKLAIEQAIYEAAPDVAEIVTEGQIDFSKAASANGLVQIERSSNNRGASGNNQRAGVGALNRNISPKS